MRGSNLLSFSYYIYRFLFIFTLVFLGAVSSAGAGEIAVMQSSAIKPYQTAISSFQAALTSSPAMGNKSIQSVQYHKIILTDVSDSRTMRLEVFRYNPDLILAVGRRAVIEAMNFTNIPVFYMLVPDAIDLTEGHQNVTGVEMEVAPELQLKEVRRLLPQVKLIGIVYDELHRATFIKEAEKAAHDLGLEISACPIKSPGEVIRGLNALDPAIDLLWLTPDPCLVSPMAREAFFLYSLQNKIPVMAFAPKYFKSGALLAIAPDLKAMGEETAELVDKFLRGVELSQLPPVATRKPDIRVNEKIAAKFNLKINSRKGQ